jgi:hypothetical protein
MKALRSILSLLLVLLLLVPTLPAAAATDSSENGNAKAVNNSIIIDDDATDGYEGDYVVIYNPATSSSTSYSTGTMTGLIDTTIDANVNTFPTRNVSNPDRPYKIDVDSQLNALSQSEVQSVDPIPEPDRASYNVGSTKSFTLVNVNTGGTYSLQFECLYVGSHCYIWTPTSTTGTYYPLDEIDPTYAKLAADEFDSKFDLMQSSFGNHTNGSQGDGKLHMLYYNIDDGWEPGQGYIAGFFYQGDISSNGLPILNIDTYPGVYYKNSAGTEYKRMDDTYSTMVHEYQHLINYSNTSGMSSWLNECFSAAAEEICYPGSSVVDRIQSWENYYYSDNDDWLNPPKEFEYQSSFQLHNGYSMYAWNNDLDDVLALYAQVSLFAQYLFTRFGNSIYRQISNAYSSSETTAITNATGVSCADLVRDFRVAVTANANGVYGFVPQDDYDPSQYNDVQNPYDLLSPIIFTGTSCAIKGGGAITVKPVNGVYNPPSGASSSLKYIGIKLASEYTITAVSNNEAWGTVSVNDVKITATPADGYYVESVEVISGTATVSVNVNTITVSPESDCTVQVNFAPKPSCTVNFVAVGNAEGSETAYIYDAITLPGSVSVNVDGWEFSGWVDAELAETTDKPAFYAPGASYTVTADATLYALYTRVEEGVGAPVYELVTAAPSDWSGNYVITNGETSSMYVLKGVNGSSNGTDAENSNNCTAYANSGITLTDNVLSDVADTYVMTFEAQGSYYSVKSASTGSYYGMNSSSYLYAYSGYNATYCNWTPGINSSHAVQLKNAANGSYPYLTWSTGNSYFWSGSSTNAYTLRLWKENAGDAVYYATSPVAVQFYTVTAVPNNTDWGSVSVDNYTITATPADGYYFSDYEVTSGTATATVNGNTIKVKPESDCTVTVIFAPIPTYTVSFVAVGYNEGSETAYVDDEITLPSSVSVNVNGWTFSGWVAAELDETTAKPALYAPGASYTVTENATLYALYTRTEEGNGEIVYELVTAAPSDWSGNYVVTNGETEDMYVLKGVSIDSDGDSIENNSNTSAFAGSGIALADDVLSDVEDDYVFTLEAEDSYYTIQSVSTGTYLGISSSYLRGYQDYNSAYCRWTPGINNDHAVRMENAAGGSYKYLGISTNGYFWAATNGDVLRLWKETDGSTVYYTTSPVPPHEHTYSEWTSNNNGTHSHTCSGCGDVVTEDCTYNDVVTYPTTTEQGYTTHTCTVCGYSYVDSYVDPVLYTVTAVSNNDAWGTVSVGGYTIIATPATGYYLSDCEVTTGTATTTVSGNTITVTPESDCTVTVNFAPIPTYTVTYISTGAPAGSATGYIGDVINLPTSVSNEPDDWTFIGWMETKLDETTEEPAYYEPGEDYTVTGDVTLYALFTRVEEGTGDVAYQLTEELAVGGRYVITNYTDVGEYAVGNTIVNTSNNHYVNALSVTTDSDTMTVPSGVDADTILYEVESGDTSAGWVFRNVANNKYLGLASDEYLTMSDTSIAWRYDYDDVQGYYYLDNQIDSDGYYYLSLDTTNYRFTTNKTAKDIRMYQEINAAVNYYTTDPVAAVGLEVTIASGNATFEYDGTLKTNYQYTVTVEGEAVEADATGLTFTLPTGDVLTITPADTAAVTHVKEGAVENAFTYSFDSNEDLYSVTATYGTLTVTPHAVTLTVVGNHDTVVYNGKSQNVKGWTLEWDDDLFGSARPTSIIEHLDPPIGEKAWMAVGTEPGTYYMNIDVSGAYLQQVDTSETAAHFVDDFDPTWEVVDGYLVIVSGPAFKTQSLVLEGQIGVNFYLDLPQIDGYEYEGVAFTIDNIDGMDAFVEFSPDMPTNNDGYYRFTYYVRSIEMADTIFATLHYTLNGEDMTLEKTYSVKQYFETYDENTDLFSDAEQAMTEATADLGHYVQAFLETQRTWTIGTDYAEMDKHYTDYTSDDISAAQTGLAEYATTKTVGANMQKITYTLVLDSDTELRVYFKPAAGYTGTFTFTVNGDPITEDGDKISVALQSDGRYMVSIKNIAAHEYANFYEIKAIDEDGNESIMTVSPLSYVRSIMANYADNAAAVNAAVAAYRYAMAATALKYGN